MKTDHLYDIVNDGTNFKENKYNNWSSKVFTLLPFEGKTPNIDYDQPLGANLDSDIGFINASGSAPFSISANDIKSNTVEVFSVDLAIKDLKPEDEADKGFFIQKKDKKGDYAITIDLSTSAIVKKLVEANQNSENKKGTLKLDLKYSVGTPDASVSIKWGNNNELNNGQAILDKANLILTVVGLEIGVAELKLSFTYGDFYTQDIIKLVVGQLEYIDSQEIVGDDMLKLFNPSPIVTMDPLQITNNNEDSTVKISGQVKDYILPIKEVLINGNKVLVTPISSNTVVPPFIGKFTYTLPIDGNDTLIEVEAINAIKNLGKDSAKIEVMRNPNTQKIALRIRTDNVSIPNEPVGYDPLVKYQFRVQLNNAISGAMVEKIKILCDKPSNDRVVKVFKDSSAYGYISNKLLLVPNSLEFPKDVSEDLKNSLIVGDFGKLNKAQYPEGGKGLLTDIGIPEGVLIYKKNSSGDLESANYIDTCNLNAVIDNDKNLSFVIRGGQHGSKGSSVQLNVRSKDFENKNVKQPEPQNIFSPTELNMNMQRKSDDINSEEYHFYTLDESEPFIAIRDHLPISSAGLASDSHQLLEVFGMYNGYLEVKMGSSSSNIDLLIEPLVGLEIVSSKKASPKIFAPAGIFPEDSPCAPIVSVANGYPRPVVKINKVNADFTSSNPNRIKVTGEILDYSANVIGGTSIDSLGIKITINDTDYKKFAAPSSFVVAPRPPSKVLPSKVAITFTLFVDLVQIPTAIDLTSYGNNSYRFSANPNARYTVAQEAIIIEVVNIVGNSSFASVFLRIDGKIIKNALGNFELTDRRLVLNSINKPTLVEFEPPKFFAHYHNPFYQWGNKVINKTILSKKENDNTLYSKSNIELKRARLGNNFEYGPFLVTTINRWQKNKNSISDKPIIEMAKFNIDSDNKVIDYEIASKLEISAIGDSMPEIMVCPAFDLKIDNKVNGLDNFLPAGTDANPNSVTINSTIKPINYTHFLKGQFNLRDGTAFTGHCNNAPRPGVAGLNKDDFSFDRNNNQSSNTTFSGFNAAGEFSQALFVKDWGGRVVVTGTLFDLTNKKLVDEPIVYMELPLDSDGDFLPDRWEEKFKLIPGVNEINPIKDGLDDSEDLDLTGYNHIHNEKGDGFTALEEYRGFQVTASAGNTQVYRMEDIPISYGGVAGLAQGPQIKDLFIYHQSTVNDKATGLLEMEATNSNLFNVAFHKLMEVDLYENQLDSTATHNHSINFNGGNDNINIIQNIIHIHDDNNLPSSVSGNVNTQLPAGVLGSSGSLTLDNIDLRIKSSAAGGSFGFADKLINGNTIFHEIGHKCSLRHTHSNTSDTINDVFEFKGLGNNNNTDFVKLNSNNEVVLGSDGVPDGEIQVDIKSFSVVDPLSGNITNFRRGSLEEFFINGIFYESGRGQEIFNNTNLHPKSQYVVIDVGKPFPAGITSFYSRTYFPSLMDWTDYWVDPNKNTNLESIQIFVNEPHKNEIRIKTKP